MTHPDPGELQLIGPAPRPPAKPPSTRTKARKRALDILFEAEVRGLDPSVLLAERSREADTPPVRAFTADLVTGVVEHSTGIDARIAEALSAGWTLQRMPRVDRNVARIAVFEIEHTDLPDRIAIAEAIELVEELSTDGSAAFVNGLLATITAGRA